MRTALGAALFAALALQGSAVRGPLLDVTPESGWRVSGPRGGPFPTDPRSYVLRAVGSEAVSWTARASAPWLTLSAAEGRVERGGLGGLTVALAPALCAALDEGLQRATVEVRMRGVDTPIVREVELRILPRRGLRVVPEGALVLDGSARPEAGVRVGGTFVVGNAGAARLTWRARSAADWLRLAPVEGSLEPGGRAEVLVELAREPGALGPDEHRARIAFENATDGTGDTTREVLLQVRGLRGLTVRPLGAGASAPFADGAEVGRYLLRNEGSAEIRFEVQSSDAWLMPEPAQGTLASGAEVTLVARAALGGGKFAAGSRAALAFVNRTDGVGTTSCWIAPGVAQETAASELAATITQFGITWTFDRPYPTGRFANGDAWVVGPLLVVRVDPPSRRAAGRTTNGSMVNPSPRSGLGQGYDSATYGKYADRNSYDAAKNVAAGLSAWQPLLLPPGSSLVSTISLPTPGARPQLAAAAVLTVLDEAAPAGSFRPPYCGVDKAVRFRRSDLRTELLRKLAPVPSAPAWPEVESWFERPWIDHVSLWAGNYIHPARNMPNYGRELCDAVSTAALMLHLDVPDERKETLLVRFVQLGIDLWGVVQDGGSFPPAAGHMSGRKWPILFAGLLLEDPAMSGVGLDPALEFGEDGQTFYVQETPPGSGVFNGGHGGYGPQLAGLADWGTAHTRQPWNDDADWFGDPYRLCCTANTWWGELLACYVMGAKPLWNHDALFDYQDRYLRENLERGVTDWRLSWRPFYLDMWREYRSRD